MYFGWLVVELRLRDQGWSIQNNFSQNEMLIDGVQVLVHANVWYSKVSMTSFFEPNSLRMENK